VQLPELYASQLALQPQAGSAGVRAWTAGQILEARVVRQALDGTVTLRIGNNEVQARTGLSLAADQAVTLQVAQSGVQTVLRVLHVGDLSGTPHATQSTAADSPEPILAQAWRQVLPRAGDLQPLLDRVRELIQPDARATARDLPEPAAQALRELIQRLPPLEKLLTASGLRRAVDDSGVFLESRLAQALAQGSGAAVQNDLKAALLQLVSQLRALPPAPGHAPPSPPAGTAPPAAPPVPAESPVAALLRQADAALARIEQHQLAAIPTQTTTAAPLLIDLPIRPDQRANVLSLRIEEHGRSGHSAEAPGYFSVWLKFDFGTLGPVQARVALGGATVSVGIWAEQPGTAALFNHHLAELDSALRAAGLATAGLHCDAGAPPAADEPARPSGLLDERA
jgi:hypothetical protein